MVDNNQTPQTEDQQVYFSFDIEIETSKDTGLLLDIPLRDNINIKTGYGPIKTRFEKVNFAVQEGKKCYDLSISNNILIIPTHNNIKTKSGKLYMEIYPIDINKKQYLFIHDNIQYPSSTISIWIENQNIYLHDINGIRVITNKKQKLIQKSWNNIEVDFNGSFYNCEELYISDIQQPFNGYIRNLKIYKRV